jgi:cyanuric acid amidohydrolase
MRRAQITSPDDVHYVQVKCPLLTKARVAEAVAAGHTVATDDTLKSMAYSRGASALGVARALDEHKGEAIADDVVCRDLTLFSRCASTSAGVELLENQILVLGNSTAWGGDFVIAHDVMADAIDTAALARVLGQLGIAATIPLAPDAQSRVAAVLAKAEPSRSGVIRGSRHTMLDDSDISGTRHARALVGGVLGGVLGTTALFVSGGAEHQGPDGGGPLAIIARKPAVAEDHCAKAGCCGIRARLGSLLTRLPAPRRLCKLPVILPGQATLRCPTTRPPDPPLDRKRGDKMHS